MRESWQIAASQEADRHAGEASERPRAGGPDARVRLLAAHAHAHEAVARAPARPGGAGGDSEPDEFFDALTSRERFATMTDDEGSVCFFDAEMGAASDEESASSGAEGGSWQTGARPRVVRRERQRQPRGGRPDGLPERALDKQGEGAVIFDRFLQGHFFQDSASPQAPAFLQKDLIAQSEHVHIAWAAPAWAEGSAGLGPRPRRSSRA